MTLVRRQTLRGGLSLGAQTLPTGCDLSDHDGYNAWCGADKIPRLNPADYRLQRARRIDNKRAWTIDELYALPQVSQVTRHACVEGWSMIGKWILPAKYGYRFNMHIPSKPGFKNRKFIAAIRVSGCRSDRGYNWFGGI